MTITGQRAATGDNFSVGSSSATSTSYSVSVSGLGSRSPQVTKKLEAAVYSHIRALRALGTTAVSSDEIARALNLSNSAVEAALRQMSDRGVKFRR
jgi:hypothetical protein